MPIVELVARRTLQSNPDLGLEVVDLIVLLWLYSNPYDSKRRQLSSMRTVLKMCEILQTPGKGIELTDDEITQIVLASLQKLKGKGLVYVRSAGVHFIKATMTEFGIGLIESSVTTPVLRRVTAEFGDNP
ncbi:MAG: hypothetical protein AM324_000490 [Candidatus Thorarchaeota archaeon SMTZ1-83]|nr:MAG: hypothetical protein AM324_01240 [Candidatus Thorarchaeota archaeon SMTZ1-83]